jgi:hypothetical protein
MCGPVPESLASDPAGRAGGRAIELGTQSRYSTRPESACTRYVMKKLESRRYKNLNKQKVCQCTQYVLVRIGMYYESLYLSPKVRTFIMQYVLSTYSVHTFSPSLSHVRTASEYVLSRTWGKKYILKRSSTSQYNTIPEYKSVRTGLY